jgi:hypothetical protein
MGKDGCWTEHIGQNARLNENPRANRNVYRGECKSPRADNST